MSKYQETYVVWFGMYQYGRDQQLIGSIIVTVTR